MVVALRLIGDETGGDIKPQVAVAWLNGFCFTCYTFFLDYSFSPRTVWPHDPLEAVYIQTRVTPYGFYQFFGDRINCITDQSHPAAPSPYTSDSRRITWNEHGRRRWNRWDFREKQFLRKLLYHRQPLNSYTLRYIRLWWGGGRKRKEKKKKWKEDTPATSLQIEKFSAVESQKLWNRPSRVYSICKSFNFVHFYYFLFFFSRRRRRTTITTMKKKKQF